MGIELKVISLTRANLLRGREKLDNRDVTVYDFRLTREEIEKTDIIYFLCDDGVLVFKNKHGKVGWCSYLTISDSFDN